MNKEEVINKINEMTVETFFSKTLFVQQKKVIELIEQLDEPQKVKIPQMVADWIDACKENWAIGLYIAMNPDFLKQWNKSDELISWVRKINNQNLFARAWLDGYEVEKLKLCKVRLKGTGQYLCNDETGIHFQHGFKTDFTKDYLEQANFGWVFDCPGIEIEEVL
jgi:hypothetical protein